MNIITISLKKFLIIIRLYVFIGIILSFVFKDDQAANYFKLLIDQLPSSLPALILHLLARFLFILLWPIGIISFI